MPPGPLEVKEKRYLTNAPPSDMPTNKAKTATLSIRHKCRVESCYIAAAATYMPAGPRGVGYSIFSAYVGSDPASTVHPPKNIRNFKHPKKIFEILATQKNI